MPGDHQANVVVLLDDEAAAFAHRGAQFRIAEQVRQRIGESGGVTGGDQVFRADRVLTRGKTITGTVVTADGTPIPGATN